MTMSFNGTSGLTFPDASTQATAATGFGFKNRIINGAMMIDQRNAGASVSLNNAGGFSCDRWQARIVGGGVVSLQQSTVAPVGFVNSQSLTVTTADSSVASTDDYKVGQFIEGLNLVDLGWGTANAQSVTLGFWVRSSLTGTYCVSLQNSAENRSYPATYVINSANTLEYKTITIPGDTSGTWLTTNGIGIRLNWNLGSGSSFNGTANSWNSADARTVSGAVNWIGTNGATFYITGVQLEKGSTATSFDYRPYGTELSLCERYYQVLGIYGAISPTATSSAVYYQTQIRTVMRATPTATFGNSTFDRMTNFGVLDYSGTYTPSINDYQPNAIAYRVNVTSGSSWSANIPMAINPTTKSQAVLLVTAEL